ncbi:MAG: hypothetical protein AVDCRST_MAG68-1438, partial [uncultured Gemmatimonadetes bacterium]
GRANQVLLADASISAAAGHGNRTDRLAQRGGVRGPLASARAHRGSMSRDRRGGGGFRVLPGAGIDHAAHRQKGLEESRDHRAVWRPQAPWRAGIHAQSGKPEALEGRDGHRGPRDRVL